VLVVVGHRTIRLALRHALEALGVNVSADAPPGREATLAARTAHPHVVLVDLSTDPTAGVDTCRQLREASRALRIVALVPRLGPAQHAARVAGASAVVTTDASVAELAHVLTVASPERAATRRTPVPGARLLTRREQEVLELAAGGLTDGQISRALLISHKTVKNHLHHAYAKLGASGRTDAVVLGVRHGLIDV
jgi:DNA-binding NarL/FixJ family response regulator